MGDTKVTHAMLFPDNSGREPCHGVCNSSRDLCALLLNEMRYLSLGCLIKWSHNLGLLQEVSLPCGHMYDFHCEPWALLLHACGRGHGCARVHQLRITPCLLQIAHSLIG